MPTLSSKRLERKPLAAKKEKRSRMRKGRKIFHLVKGRRIQHQRKPVKNISPFSKVRSLL